MLNRRFCIINADGDLTARGRLKSGLKLVGTVNRTFFKLKNRELINMKIPGSKPILFGTLGLVGIGAYTYSQSNGPDQNAQAIQDILPRMERAEIYEGSGDLYEGSGQDITSI